MTDPTPSSPEGSQKSDNGEAAKQELELSLAPDSMSAHLHGQLDGAQDLAAVREAVTGLLKRHGVKQGVVRENLLAAMETLARGEAVDGVLVAKGKPPTPGQDGRIEAKVDIQTSRIGRINKHGHIDFKDKGPLQLVEPGAVLAELLPQVKGEPGTDILGKKVNPPPVRRQRLRTGAGAKLERDGQVAVATVQGLVSRPEADKFEVLELFEVRGDVDYHTGHIEFPGLVQVSGAVLPDFKVKAKTLEAGELEPGSVVEVSEALTVMGGVMGATVISGGTMTARFIRDSNITAKGDVLVESEIVQSEVSTEGRVIISQGDGRIVNSKVAAVRGVIAGEIISSGAGGTRIKIGASAEYEQRVFSLRKRISNLDKEQEELIQKAESLHQELKGVEDELRGLLANLKNPDQKENRDNFMTQVDMIKPIRADLVAQTGECAQRLEEIYFERQAAADKLAGLEAVMPEGAVYLDVRKSAAPTTEIRFPRAAITLTKHESSFSARGRKSWIPKAASASR